MAEQSSSWVGRVLREPTLHFALLAAALFGASAALRSGGNVIEIDRVLPVVNQRK